MYGVVVVNAIRCGLRAWCCDGLMDGSREVAREEDLEKLGSARPRELAAQRSAVRTKLDLAKASETTASKRVAIGILLDLNTERKIHLKIISVLHGSHHYLLNNSNLPFYSATIGRWIYEAGKSVSKTQGRNNTFSTVLVSYTRIG